MIVSEKIIIKKQLPFNAAYIEKELKSLGYEVLRWAVTEVTNDSFIIDAAIITKN